MTTFALILVLSAALLHATWNSMLKASGDRLLAIAGIAAGHMVFGLILVPFLPLPAAESWPYLIGSIVVHYLYFGGMFFGYRFGDLSQVYPISRGMAPVLVALSVQLFAGETLPLAAWAGIITVSTGIGLLSLRGWRANRRAILFAMATGLMIATYSVLDGLGARASGNVLSYIAWLSLADAGLPLVVWLKYRRQSRLRDWVPSFSGGVMSVFAYALVLYAKTIAPIGAVSAIRESSVAIAALIGIIWLKERPWLWRLLCAGIVAAGVLILALNA